MSKILIRNLNHTFILQDGKQIPVIENINLKIEKSEFIVILGESGCGKTTFLNILAGLLEPANGSVFIDNEKIQGPSHKSALIFQKPCLLPWLNVKENILFGFKLRKEKSDIDNKVSKYINLMGLNGFEKVYPVNLSQGMAQRVAFTRALIGQPDILLLDEPFTSLDFYNRTRLQSELIRNWLFEHYTIIFVTHDIDEAILLGRKIVLLSNKPANIVHIFEVDSKYPRDLKNKKLFELKIEIQKKFEDLFPCSLNNIKPNGSSIEFEVNNEK